MFPYVIIYIFAITQKKNIRPRVSDLCPNKQDIYMFSVSKGNYVTVTFHSLVFNTQTAHLKLHPKFTCYMSCVHHIKENDFKECNLLL